MTDDLLAFLRARLADDERVAQAAADFGPTWRGTNDGIYPSDESRHPGPIAVGTYAYLDDQYAGHIAHWDPARVLAEVAAKQRIVEWCIAVQDRMIAPAPLVAMNVLAALAQPYADHPDYRAEWAA